MYKFSLSDSEVFSILFNGISEGALIVNNEQQIVELNQSLANMFGYDVDELKGKHLDRLIPQKFHHKHHSHVKTFLKKEEKRQMGKGRNIYGLKKCGNVFPVEAGLNPFDINGEKFVMALITDITKRVEDEKKIKNLNTYLENKVAERTNELQHSIEELSELNELLKDEIIKRKEAEARIKTALQKERELNDLKNQIFIIGISRVQNSPKWNINFDNISLKIYQNRATR